MTLYQVDAFTDKLFSGNPAAVCPLEKWLPDEIMQQLAMENNLAETAFFVPNKDGSFHLRWFTPTVEVDLCGHATLAAAFVLFNERGYNENMIRFQSKSGELKVSRDGAMITLDFPSVKPEPTPPPVGLLEGLNVSSSRVYFGAWDYMVVLDNQDAIEQLAPDFPTLSKVNSRGIIATAKSNDVDFVSRCFYPQSGINEDPVTGSAHTITTTYWANELNKTKLIAKQLSPRGGTLICELKGDRVLMSGKGRLYLKGEYNVD
ncbi:MAG: PhzF family phenazine biosynthesis protein [Chitinophagaceae bacterium]|jgi:PhzF family phenazine biosynthesis protein|nr:PhzF family phenazine biosynthesis protein [Chitinophagaceae bacterium]